MQGQTNTRPGTDGLEKGNTSMDAKVVVIEHEDGFSVHVATGGVLSLSVALRQAEAVRRETRAACIHISQAIQKRTGLPEEILPWGLNKAVSTAQFYEAVEGRAAWLSRKSQRDLREKAEASQRLRKEALGYRYR